MVDFIEALETWVEESILRRFQKASVFFCVLADECTDNTASFLSLGGRWHFFQMLFGHCAFKESRCYMVRDRAY